ncbi:DUF669 domain-containing protein [Agrobacterium tumefaciens]|uniref:DUF669 domain-containing protein n=1 Tax=Agrobacterium tumefaciens TaxID=358 RepID=UPI001572F1D5|nr:DUF669 domain-containing protein [Agrobacterium tumefaciens]NTA48182.1 DUF669 domain-containing protein [Agrobacterium tumefaciens]
MAKIGIRVEATEENTQQRDFTNLPNGDYQLEISGSEIKEKNEGTRDHAINLSVSIDVLAPEELKGRKIFNNYNLQHPNPQVQEIGQRQFACLLRSLGLTEAPEDSDELHFISFFARIGMGKDSKDKNADGTPKYAARNELKKYYYPDEGNLPEPKVEAAPPAANDNRRTAASNDNKPAAAAAGTTRRPWGAK